VTTTTTTTDIIFSICCNLDNFTYNVLSCRFVCSWTVLVFGRSVCYLAAVQQIAGGHRMMTLLFLHLTQEPGKHSQYCDCATCWSAEEFLSDSWQGQEIFLFAKASKSAVGSIQSYLMGIRGSFPSGKICRAWSWQFTSI
jgi:hypothetical protein